MSAPDFSVVIPTYNRMDTLPEVLDALDAQEDAPAFEVIVVDDGSTDGTWGFLESRLGKRHPDESSSRPAFTPVRQENAGPARARHWGGGGRGGAGRGDVGVPGRAVRGASAGRVQFAAGVHPRTAGERRARPRPQLGCGAGSR